MPGCSAPKSPIQPPVEIVIRHCACVCVRGGGEKEENEEEEEEILI